MKEGDRVEVSIIWAAGGPLEAPKRAWFRGYVFDSFEPGKGTVLVKHASSGVFDGMIVRYPAGDVRPERAKP